MVLPLNLDLKLEVLRNPSNRAIRYTTSSGKSVALCWAKVESLSNLALIMGRLKGF